jgi:branched-chain amino acid transport system substrate-binding protein
MDADEIRDVRTNSHREEFAMFKRIAASGMLRSIAVASVLALGTLANLSAAGAAQELRIGFLAPTTGIFAQIGKDMTNGFQLYLDEAGGDFAGAR